jgi:acyl-CoA dehydrogenase
VIGGKGVCMGPGNFLARAYQQIPVAITVEGANIMTRTLIIYGQGAIRCHPYVLPMMRTAEMRDLKAFDRALFGYVGFVLGNMARAVGFSLTGGALITAPRDAAPELRRYYRQGTRLSTLLALASDVSMATVGGALKRKGALTGRLGDMLSQLFILSAALKRFEDEGRPAEDLPFIHWAAQDALNRATTAWRDLLANHPSRGAALFLKLAGAPFGLKAPTPGDNCAAEVAGLIQRHGPARDRLVAGSWSASLEVDPIAAVLVAFDLYPQVEVVEARLKSAIRTGRLSRAPQDLTRLADWAREAETQGLIDADESVLIARYADVAIQAIMVDDFPQDFGLAEGLARREAASGRPGATGKGRQAA